MLWFLLCVFIISTWLSLALVSLPDRPDFAKALWQPHHPSILFIAGCIGVIGGFIIFQSDDLFEGQLWKALKDLAPEMVGMAFTVVVIDELVERSAERRSQQEFKERTIEQLFSPVRDVAVEALRLAIQNDWLEDFVIESNRRGSTVGNGIQWSGAELAGVNLQNANLFYANLEGANLGNANLENAWLSSAYLEGAKLSFAKLRGASLNHTRQKGNSLYNADLREANLFGANLENVNLSGANLAGADLSRANLIGADLWHTNLQDALFDNTIISDSTRWPDNCSVQIYCRNIDRLSQEEKDQIIQIYSVRV